MRFRILHLTALLLLAGAPLLAQSSAFRPLEPRESALMYRDGERWIRERFRWFRQQRLGRDGEVPAGAREQAWAQSRAMPVHKPSRVLGKAGGTGDRWMQAGPVNIGGRITGIAIHPSNPDIVYFTAADGGVWKSTNGTKIGASFDPVADDLPTMAMGSIDIDPNDPNVVVVGTGEANGSADSYPGVGVVLSTDAGATWAVAGGSEMRNIGSIKFHKDSGTVILAASRQGLYRSSNRGKNWSRVVEGLAHNLVMHPTDHAVAYAGVQGKGLMKTADHGLTWELLNTGVGADTVGRVALDLCLTQPQYLYAVIVGAKGVNTNKTHAVLKSTDGGVTWARISDPLNPQNYFSSYGWYNCELAVHPLNPAIVSIGGVGQYRSTDGGAKFNAVGGVHVDQHAQEYSPTAPDVCFLGNDGGIYISGDGGKSYRSLNDNLPITQFYELGMAAQNHDLIIGGTQDNGSNTRDAGTDQWVHSSGGDGGYCVIDHQDSKYQYTEYQNGSHLRSSDGGRTFTGINRGLIGNGPWVTPVAMHPVDSKVLFTCTTRQLYRTSDRGDLWVPWNHGLDSSSTINVIAISPLDPDLMLVGFGNGKISRSTDGGVTWAPTATGLPGRTCTDIQFHPADPNVYYCTHSGYGTGGVYISTDAGATWTSIAGNLPNMPRNGLAINPGKPEHLFVATDFGVYTTLDGGATWSILGDGMPKVVVVDLELHPGTGRLYAATHGRSVFMLDVVTPVRMTAFSAVHDGAGALLRWRSSLEGDNRGYAVERSADGGAWTEIGFVPSKGPTPSVNLYEYADQQIPPACAQAAYRLRIVDGEGRSAWSEEVLLRFGAVAPAVCTLEQNYPNPFNPVTTIRYTLPREGRARIGILDALGREVAVALDREESAGTHAVTFDAARFPGGAYFYQLEYAGTRLTRRMLLLK